MYITGAPRRWLAAVSASVLVFPLTAMSAGSDAPARESHVIRLSAEGPAPVLTAEEVEDLTRYAKQVGADPEQEINGARGVEQFASVVETLQNEFPDIFVGEMWDPPWSTAARAAVTVNEDPPARFIEELETVGVPIDIVVKRLPTRVERLKATETAHNAVREFLQSDQVFTIADQDTGAITVRATAPPDDRATLQASAKSHIRQAFNEQQLTRFTVNVELVTDPVVVDESGGYRLSGCTGGYSVKKVQKKTGAIIGWGISTAAHCSGMTTYNGRAITAGASNTSADVRWYQYNSGTDTALFQYQLGMTRNVTTVANPVLNQRICDFGYGTVDYGGGGNPSGLCAYVAATGSCTATTCSKVVMDSKVTVGGDSGGPWYFGSTAKGIHSGEALVGSGSSAHYVSQFAPISSLLGLLDVQVVT